MDHCWDKGNVGTCTCDERDGSLEVATCNALPAGLLGVASLHRSIDWPIDRFEQFDNRVAGASDYRAFGKRFNLSCED